MVEEHDVKDNTAFKRKKRSSFNQRIKKKFRSRKEGHCDQVEYDYFIRVLQLSRTFEGTQEEKVVFANNALAQTENKEVESSSNQLVSRVIETLLPLASEEVLVRFFEAFGSNLRPICNHEYASHVLQALMISATRHSLNEPGEVKNEHEEKCKAWLIKVCKYLLNNIEEFIELKYANHLLRTAMYCLAGSPQLDHHSKQQDNALTKGVEETPASAPSEEFVQLLEQFYKKISAWPQFNIFVETPLLSGFLQSLLRALHSAGSKKYHSLCKKILAECFMQDSDDMTETFSPVSLPVLEIIIENCKEKLLVDIYEKLLKGKLSQMATAQVGKLTVKKFLNNCNNAEMVSEILTELLPEFSNIIESSGAILVSLAQACQRLKTPQSQFLKGLQDVLKWKSCPDQLVPAVLSLTPLPLPEGPPPPPTLNGSLLVQALLKFQKPIKVVDSLLAMKSDQLVGLLCSRWGCYLTQAFCQSEHIGKESRFRLIKHLKGSYPEIAKSKWGSRSFDDIWAIADQESLTIIAKDLSGAYSSLASNPIGKFIVAKVRLDEFRSLPADVWLRKLQNQDKKRKMFESIVGDVKSKVKKEKNE